MKKILSDLLVHFLVLGLGLFVLFNMVASDDAAYDSRVINVGRQVVKFASVQRTVQQGEFMQMWKTLPTW